VTDESASKPQQTESPRALRTLTASFLRQMIQAQPMIATQFFVALVSLMVEAFTRWPSMAAEYFSLVRELAITTNQVGRLLQEIAALLRNERFIALPIEEPQHAASVYHIVDFVDRLVQKCCSIGKQPASGNGGMYQQPERTAIT
jgi:hypothetical protein